MPDTEQPESTAALREGRVALHQERCEAADLRGEKQAPAGELDAAAKPSFSLAVKGVGADSPCVFAVIQVYVAQAVREAEESGAQPDRETIGELLGEEVYPRFRLVANVGPEIQKTMGSHGSRDPGR